MASTDGRAAKRFWPLAMLAIAAAVLVAVAFLLPFGRGPGFWVGLASCVVALLVAAGTWLRVSAGRDLKSRAYGWPLLSVAWRYAAVQAVAGLAEMLLSPWVPWQIGLAVNIILLGACLLGLVATDTARGEVERLDRKIKEQTSFIQSLRADLEGLADRAADGGAKRDIRALAEAVRYSDPMSHPQLAALEGGLGAKAAQLAQAVAAGDGGASAALAGELQLLLSDRNRKCRMLK